jgi:coenzyme F420 hydrogenase subunit beta
MPWSRLYQDCISKNLCVECGACALVCPRKVIEFKEVEFGLEPELVGRCSGDACNLCREACPGPSVPRSEIEMKMMGRTHDKETRERFVGAFQKLYIGQSVDPDVLKVAASGGTALGLLLYGLKKGIFDGALVCGGDPEKPWQSIPRVVTTREGVLETSNSRYDPFPQLLGLREAMDMGLKRIAVVAVPCVIHALRKMELSGKPYQKIIDRIALIIGLWCYGHFSRRGIEYLITWRLGVPLDQVSSLVYRARPWPGNFTVTKKDGSKISNEFVHRHILHRLTSSFIPDACRACQDANADLADIAMGDPWGHPMDAEALRTGIGWTACQLRTRRGVEIFEAALRDGGFKANLIPEQEHGFLERTGAVLHKHFGYAPQIKYRERHGLPTRKVT